MDAPMCSQCDLMKIAEELSQMPLVLTPEETARVMRVAVSSVYAWASQKKVPLACKKPIRIPTIWVMKQLGFGEEQHEKGLKLVSSK